MLLLAVFVAQTLNHLSW